MADVTILLVDDQPEILEPVKRRLEAEGYQVLAAFDGEEAVEVFGANQPALIVLDMMMPKLDGLGVCRRIRQHSDVPILMLSARSEESDIVVGLELGADDYLTKPFRVNELIARIRALLRRKPPVTPPEPEAAVSEVLLAGKITLDPVRCEVQVSGRQVALTPLEFRLLTELMKNPGQVLSREVILQTVWGYEGYDLGLVNTHIKRLRAKVEDDPAAPEIIQTVRGFGYKIAS